MPAIDPVARGAAAAVTAAAKTPSGARDPDVAPQPAELVPAPPLLATVAAPDGLHPHFPGREPGTGVVLYGSRPGTLRAHWRLAPDDLRRAGGSFPSGGGHPVLRLRRARPDGGAERVDEASLLAVVREGAGETTFPVAADHGRYHAELGLTNGGGGWLLLARSNELDNVSPVGVDLRRLEPAPHPQPQPQPQPGTGLTVDDPEPALVAVSPGSLVSVFPLVTITGMDRVDDGAAASWGAATPVGRLPLGEVGVTALARRWDLPAADAGSTQCALEGRPVRLPRPGESDVGPGLVSPVLSPVPTDAVTFSPLTPLAYGHPPSAVAGLQVEAELRITGQAAPGSLIDLFGQPFRVGPGGRFQLVVRVDDPALLRQALALNPPPELTLTRDQ
ncbi:hypothetical protein [uncultured Thiodictyon sp.]|uniref:hypothetical protein n=1 Tax=uncultured Thiodictyon sp. TaxID=1846217 RepID=UPI0026015F60|nr:hypothetical protein [uncultured Thiodictyon sp.]